MEKVPRRMQIGVMGSSSDLNYSKKLEKAIKLAKSFHHNSP